MFVELRALYQDRFQLHDTTHSIIEIPEVGV